ncbi:hypothetical protein BEWA_019270 [Theileria equi strain WA]|uniref:Uncharacterized protein n=1 Tax=Theileria equi strain WA TaxID=1537102 RepID=L0ATV9_THEEQ|nr:hypothetical protein BEWA_019270 [Theileria equi strain WA]AFZ79082.1 hypothetical protein BEWA_019270 [Theileria equi strain WA]|eukprot:XP_004828748.1 hypothetical protein BEWA_019270 [Theileria equi strain WA]
MRNIGINRFEYMKHVKEDSVYRKFSPQSKCLLTCMITKFNKDLRQMTGSNEFIVKIFRDFSDKKSMLQLNLESINMLLVSSYKLKIPLTHKELSLILERIHTIITPVSDSIFSNELTLSVLHSLGNFARIFPKYHDLVRDSPPLQEIKENFELYSKDIRLRDLSLAIYALERLKLVNENLARVLISTIKKIQALDNTSLATILYSSCKNHNMRSIFNILNDHVLENLGKFTTREICNVSCAYLKAKLWRDDFFPYLSKHLPLMNIQELCNVIHLLINMKVSVPSQFKNAYIFHLPTFCRYSLDLIDYLTIAQSLYKWMPQNGTLLDEGICKMISCGRYKLDSKFLYLIHYCKELRLSNSVYKLLNVVDSGFDLNLLNSRETVILYSILRTYELPSLHHKIESLIINRPFLNFSSFNLQILISVGTDKVVSDIIQKFVTMYPKPTIDAVDIATSIIKGSYSESFQNFVLLWFKSVIFAPSSSKKFNLIAKCLYALSYMRNVNSALIMLCRSFSILNEKEYLDVLSFFDLVKLLSVSKNFNYMDQHVVHIAEHAVNSTKEYENIDIDTFLEMLKIVSFLDFASFGKEPAQNIGKFIHAMLTIFPDELIKREPTFTDIVFHIVFLSLNYSIDVSLSENLITRWIEFNHLPSHLFYQTLSIMALLSDKLSVTFLNLALNYVSKVNSISVCDANKNYSINSADTRSVHSTLGALVSGHDMGLGVYPNTLLPIGYSVDILLSMDNV